MKGSRTPQQKKVKEQQAEIRKLFREHARETRRTALMIRAYQLATWAILNARQL